MNERICENINCDMPILSFNHLNRKYCSDECYYENKLRLTNEKNEQKKTALHLAKMDDILKEIYEEFGAMQYINAAILECKNFDWSLCTMELEIQSLEVKGIKNYGYTLFKNETVLIWRI